MSAHASSYLVFVLMTLSVQNVCVNWFLYIMGFNARSIHLIRTNWILSYIFTDSSQWKWIMRYSTQNHINNNLCTFLERVPISHPHPAFDASFLLEDDPPPDPDSFMGRLWAHSQSPPPPPATASSTLPPCHESEPSEPQSQSSSSHQHMDVDDCDAPSSRTRYTPHNSRKVEMMNLWESTWDLTIRPSIASVEAIAYKVSSSNYACLVRCHIEETKCLFLISGVVSIPFVFSLIFHISHYTFWNADLSAW